MTFDPAPRPLSSELSASARQAMRRVGSSDRPFHNDPDRPDRPRGSPPRPAAFRHSGPQRRLHLHRAPLAAGSHRAAVGPRSAPGPRPEENHPEGWRRRAARRQPRTHPQTHRGRESAELLRQAQGPRPAVSRPDRRDGQPGVDLGGEAGALQRDHHRPPQQEHRSPAGGSGRWPISASSVWTTTPTIQSSSPAAGSARAATRHARCPRGAPGMMQGPELREPRSRLTCGAHVGGPAQAAEVSRSALATPSISTHRLNKPPTGTHRSRINPRRWWCSARQRRHRHPGIFARAASRCRSAGTVVPAEA